MSETSFVFISYAHLDGGKVLPCIRSLRQNGIRLWYDEGIEAGSEWPEFIAEKVIGCTKFILFVSNAYLNSQNCKRELNFAISRKKEILTIYLEDVTLSPGMEMQLGTYQAIYSKRFSSADAFHQSLCREAFFDACRDVPVNRYASYNNSTASLRTDTAPEYRTAPPKTNTGFTPAPQPAPGALPVKNKIVAGLLAIFLGYLGIHKFYLGQKRWGIVYLLLFWTYITFFLAIAEGIVILCSSDRKFCEKYHCRVE